MRHYCQHSALVEERLKLQDELEEREMLSDILAITVFGVFLVVGLESERRS